MGARERVGCGDVKIGQKGCGVSTKCWGVKLGEKVGGLEKRLGVTLGKNVGVLRKGWWSREMVGGKKTGRWGKIDKKRSWGQKTGQVWKIGEKTGQG